MQLKNSSDKVRPSPEPRRLREVPPGLPRALCQRQRPFLRISLWATGGSRGKSWKGGDFLQVHSQV